MQKKKIDFLRGWNPGIRSLILVGLALLLVVMLISGHKQLRLASALTDKTLDTLKQQCLSYNKLLASDRTQSLFRLAELLQAISYKLEEQPELVGDDYLEQQVNCLRITGITLLDGDLKLEASGYTHQFRDPYWQNSERWSRLADIIEHPAKVFAERVQANERYYDVCAVARRDAPGIVVGFYRQPAALVSGAESEMASLLSGLHLDRGGIYAIAKDDVIRATSDVNMQNDGVSENAILRQLDQMSPDGVLRLFYTGERFYLGCRTGCEGYMVYIYYPVSSVFSGTWLAAMFFAAAYFILWAVVFAFRNRVLFENQEALRDSNRQLTETINILQSLETIYFTLFYVDVQGNRYESIYFAPWLASFIQPSGDYAALKKSFIDTLVVPEFREELDQRMEAEFIRESLSRERITEVRKSYYTDYQAYRAGETKWCRVSVTVVDFDETGKPAHVLVMFQDVDGEKKKEAEYQERILQEAQQAKVANNAKTEFLRRISHDIRTPINGIKGYISMAAHNPRDLALQEECREKASTAVGTLMALVDSVLEMSKLESSEIKLESKPFDLTTLVNEVNTLVEPQAMAKNIRYEVLRQGCLPVPNLIGSPRHLRQVLMNLASNAVKYGNPGGYVRLNSRLVSTTEDTATYEFTCEDNGIGMSEEFQQHMFEPFTQELDSARTTFEGTGLGLSIVKKLVDSLGGTITCQSQKRVGTTFCVTLTFQIDKAYGMQADGSCPTGDCPLKDANVLLVEDNRLNMEIAEFLLTSHGAHVTKAWNGQEAVDTFAASEPEHFDIIFMDIMMPVLDGLEAARAIRALPRPDAATVRISAMSANAFSDDIQRSLNAGMNAHIPKPVDEKTLLSVASQLLADRKKDRQAHT